MGKRQPGRRTFRNRRPNSKTRRLLRSTLFEEQDGECFYCDQPMFMANHAGTPGPRTATFEHVDRYANGGSYDASKIVLACCICNSMRGTLSFTDYLQQRRAQLRLPPKSIPDRIIL